MSERFNEYNRPRESGELHGPAQLRDRLVAAGFDETEVKNNVGFNHIQLIGGDWGKEFTDDSLKLLAQVGRQLPSRENIYALLVANPIPEAKTSISRSLDRLSRLPEERNTQVTQDLAGIFTYFGDTEYDYRGRNSIRLASLCRIRADEGGLNQLFNNNLSDAREYIIKYERENDLSQLLSRLSILEDIENREILYSGIDIKKLDKFSTGLVKLMSQSAASAEAFNAFMRSGQGWSDRIRLFKPVLAAHHLSYRAGWEQDESILENIRINEDPNNVLVHLFGMTYGWEIEYDNDTVPVQKASNSSLFRTLPQIGFKSGGGGGGSLEASPGPFYYPKTGIAVLRQYDDAKIIDTEGLYGLTFHFNVGVGMYLDAFDLVPIVRGQELTGTAVRHHESSDNDEIYMYNHHGDYKEGKVYAVNSREDFEYNFNASAQLALALRMSKERAMGVTGPGKVWRDQLADLYDEYHERLRAGLAYLGRQKLLDSKTNWSYDRSYERKRQNPDEVWARGQLRRVLPDPTYKHQPDPAQVGPKTKEEKTRKGIEGLEVDGVWYRNIVQYAREVTNDIVGRIESLKDGIQEQAVEDIQAIEVQGNRTEREKMIAEFNRKYNVPCENPQSSIYREAAYRKVKAVYFPEKPTTASVN